jgi:hypothetical protein
LRIPPFLVLGTLQYRHRAASNAVGNGLWGKEKKSSTWLELNPWVMGEDPKPSTLNQRIITSSKFLSDFVLFISTKYWFLVLAICVWIFISTWEDDMHMHWAVTMRPRNPIDCTRTYRQPHSLPRFSWIFKLVWKDQPSQVEVGTKSWTREPD